MSTAQSLSINGVSKRYGKTVALENLSISVSRGSFLTLLGPSGSGKTTLLTLIAGFTDPDQGQIVLEGQDITALPPERRNFGMVFQGYALFPHLSVAENIAFPLQLRNVARAQISTRVESALDLVQLKGYGDRSIRQLSGGQQQRVALARALVFEPNLLLLDEPLSALDKQLRAELQWELKEVHNRVGTTFICVTHDQGEALSLSNEIAILRDGRLQQKGTPQEIYGSPVSRFVASFMGMTNIIDGTVERHDGSGFQMRRSDAVLLHLGRGPAAKLNEQVCVVVPEDQMRLTSQAEENAIEVTVLGSSFLGAGYQVRARTHGGLALTAFLSNGVEPPQNGARCFACWSPRASIRVFNDVVTAT